MNNLKINIQEIKKVNDISYHSVILAELIKEKKIIKKSNDILQILLNSYIEKEKLIYIEELLNGKMKQSYIKSINFY